ncbi:hypothetical protein BC828DRAFT_402937 [Blastocladiella britannica]|nr:hypothetical protein BC828DRAFT_402937 [Blastocladiella britannica]
MTKSIFSTLLVLAASVMIATAVNQDGTGGKPTPPNGLVRNFSTGADGNWSTGEIKVTLATPGVLRVWDGGCLAMRTTKNLGIPAAFDCATLKTPPSAKFTWDNSRGEYSLTAGDHTLQFVAVKSTSDGPSFFSVTEISQRCAKPVPYHKA